MGVVVPFRQKDAEKPRRRAKAIEGAGEILLFTGVRYERYDAPSQPAAQRKAPKRA